MRCEYIFVLIGLRQVFARTAASPTWILSFQVEPGADVDEIVICLPHVHRFSCPDGRDESDPSLRTVSRVWRWEAASHLIANAESAKSSRNRWLVLVNVQIRGFRTRTFWQNVSQSIVLPLLRARTFANNCRCFGTARRHHVSKHAQIQK